MEQKHWCQACRARKARFQYRGVVKADRTHTLCFACFRSERDRQRARGLAASALDRGPAEHHQSRAPFGVMPTVMTPTQRAHRARMLAHLTRTRR